MSVERFLERWLPWWTAPVWSWPEEPRRGWPAADVYRGDGRLVVEVELPGVRPDEVDVRVHEDRVTVRAEVRHEEGIEEEGYVRAERRYGAVFRSIPLPAPVDPAGARATYRHGVLRVEAPLRDEAAREGRRVPVEPEQ